MPRKRCLFCREWFEPYIPRAKLQQICGASACRRKFKRLLDRAWRRRDPQWSKERRRRRRNRWRVYMRGYRSEHAEYRAREVARKKRRRASDRKTGVLTSLSVEETEKSAVRQEFIDARKGLGDNVGA
jgi:hypothetical protein